jgi:hypothetical protein
MKRAFLCPILELVSPQQRLIESMRTSGAACCLLAASALALVSADRSKPGETGHFLRGQVVDGLSGRPIRRVELRLSDLHWKPVGEPVAPDSHGYFVFSGLPAGEYILSADGPETGKVFFDELPEPQFVQTIHLKPEEPDKSVIFRIVPRVSIGGTVQDEFGDPVEQAPVTFYCPAWVDGRIALAQAQQTATDDRGRFRCADVCSICRLE